MPGRASLRASDADREQIAERLRQAAVEGRLLAHELEHRVAAALRASTYGQLDALVSDLPGPQPARRRLAPPVVYAGLAVVALVAVLAVLAALVISGAIWIIWCVFAWAWFGGRRRGYSGGDSARGYSGRGQVGRGYARGCRHQSRRIPIQAPDHPGHSHWV